MGDEVRGGELRLRNLHLLALPRAYQLLYPWLTVYFLLNTLIVPIGK